MGKKKLIRKKSIKKKSNKNKSVEKSLAEYECYLCHKLFSKTSNLNTHFKSHHLGRKFVCEYCGKDFVSDFSRQRHMDRVHEEIVLNENRTTNNEIYMGDLVGISDKAKMNIIKNLRSDLEKKQKIINNQVLIIRQLKQKLETYNCDAQEREPIDEINEKWEE